MSYLWTDKITDYYYSNPELDTVAVMWTDPEDKLTREHYIKVDESDEQWRDFVAEVSYEKIDERTVVRHEQFREQFRDAFREWAGRNEDDIQNRTQSNKFEDVIINFSQNLIIQMLIKKNSCLNSNSKYLNKNVLKIQSQLTSLKMQKLSFVKQKVLWMFCWGYMVFANGAELKMADKEKFQVEGVYVPIK